jgi:RHS repeat-associated protein
MIVDQTGTLANLRRHDYLPFGEELFAPAGGRSASLGYIAGDDVRQQFTEKERDVETGLDYFEARYYSSSQGRFTSVDPYDVNLERQDTDDQGEAERKFSRYIFQPQHWNHYTYVLNNPLKFIDPDGWKEANTFTANLLGQDVTITVDKKNIEARP